MITFERDLEFLKNGTYVFFKTPDKMTSPQFKTSYKILSNHFRLRKILTRGNVTIKLIDSTDNNKSKICRFDYPKGKELESFSQTIQYNGMKFEISGSIWKSIEVLEQIQSEERIGGLLILDDYENVLDISLFKYDKDNDAENLYGEVKINGFITLLKNDETILNQERLGFVKNHPFYSNFEHEIEKYLSKIVDRERLEKKKRLDTKLDRHETQRFKKAFSIFNNIAIKEIQDVKNLGHQPSDIIVLPENGLEIYPNSSSITVNKRNNFELIVNTKIIRPGSMIIIESTNSDIHHEPSEICIDIIDIDKHERVIKYITVIGQFPNIEGKLIAKSKDIYAEAQIFVIPEETDKELLMEEGLLFQPDSIIIHPNKVKIAWLYIYTKIIKNGSKIELTIDNSTINFEPQKIIVNDYEAKRHILKCKVEIWGSSIGERGYVTAQSDIGSALLEVFIKEKKAAKQGKKGLFKEPVYDHLIDPVQPISFNSNTGDIKIYLNFPIVEHFLGKDRIYRKTLSAQVFEAQMISTMCFYQISKRKNESSYSRVDPEALPDKIQRDSYELSKKYGEKIAEALIDDKLTESDRRNNV